MRQERSFCMRPVSYTHLDVYKRQAIYLNGLVPIYVYPEYKKDLQINGAVSAEDIRKAIRQNPDIKAVILVSPTYDGVLSDVEKISKIVHEMRIPLIVDEMCIRDRGMDLLFLKARQKNYVFLLFFCL